MDRLLVIFACVLLISACAVPVNQISLTRPMAEAADNSFTLKNTAQISVGTGYNRTLRAGTHWRRVGVIDKGDVYRPLDQLLTVEGYNVHEAYIVTADLQMVGFYLPVEKTFVPISKKIVLNIEDNQEK